MGKKIAKKDAAGRRDKFYYQAKESGYRARSAFKILELNQEHGFFKGATSCIDLCSAPGSWCQVAIREMDPNSVIIGVDLARIPPIPGCAFFQADITTPACRSKLQKGIRVGEKLFQIKKGNCDVVMHDGAPNVGANWLRDAAEQNQLVLKSLELATEFLRVGGHFITKVFRSQDSDKLSFVCSQLFDRVKITKPEGSRNVSAEIFFVCKGYKGGIIDKKFFDVNLVFGNTDTKEVMVRPEDAGVQQQNKAGTGIAGKSMATLVAERDSRRKRGGYDSGDDFRTFKVIDFFSASNPGELITGSNKFVWTDDKDKEGSYENILYTHQLTTVPILNTLNDLRSHGTAELTQVLKWRHAIRNREYKAEKSRISAITRSQAKDDIANLRDLIAFNDSDQEMEREIEEDHTMTEEMKEIILAREKADRKKLKKKRELEKKNLLRMKISQSNVDIDDTQDYFTNSQMKAYRALKEAETNKDIDWEKIMDVKPMGYTEPEPTDKELLRTGEDDALIDDIVVIDKDDVFTRLNKDVKKNLIVEKAIKRGLDAETEALRLKKERRRDKKMREWTEEMEKFVKDQNENKEIISSNSESDSDDAGGDDIPDENEMPSDNDDNDSKETDMSDNVLPVPGLEENQNNAEIIEDEYSDESDSDNFASDSDEFADADKRHIQMLPLNERKKAKMVRKKKIQQEEKRKSKLKAAEDKLLGGLGGAMDDDEVSTGTRGVKAPAIEVVPTDPDDIAYIQAVGRKMIETKGRIEVMDGSYNRWSFNDQSSLPSWFNEEEDEHMKPISPVTKAEVAHYRAKMKEINERPIRKVVEARQRKKLKLARRLEQVRKKAHQIAANSDMNETAKSREIQKLSNKARSGMGQREKRYITSSASGSKAAGKLKSKNASLVFVDKRMKKEKRAMKSMKRRMK